MSEARQLAADLKFTYIRDNVDDLIVEARRKGQDCEKFLLELLTGEAERRAVNGIARRIKDARFPIKKYLVDFDRNKYSAEFLPKFSELETLRFVDNKENVILIGTPGAGKTHYATALGIAACMAGKSVLFSNAPNLIVEIKEAMNQQQFTAYRGRFERYNLVILDELGYLSFDKYGGELLFNLLSNRHGKGSVIITTNLSFERWETVFGDPVLTGALIDRMAHKAHILDISREQGGRLEETLAWLSNTRPNPALETA